jgi:hypothetical protein
VLTAAIVSRRWIKITATQGALQRPAVRPGPSGLGDATALTLSTPAAAGLEPR